MASQKTLIGRAVERATLGRLLQAVRRGEGQVLVLRGEPGVGKTALMDDAIGSATDLRVLRAVGVESEMNLHSPPCTSSVRRCSIGSGACPVHSRLRCGWPLA